MKQEDKELLLRDLCARLSYGVICTDSRHGDSRITEIDIVEETVYCDDFDECVEVDRIKPYLRSMSSMTEEEEKEFESLGWRVDELDDNEPWNHNSYNVFDGIDWLNAHHFDYRGLIKKNLALEALEGMYK